MGGFCFSFTGRSRLGINSIPSSMITFFNTALSSQASAKVNSSAERLELQTAKLSSGSRLNTTGDDAGATAQSMKFRAAAGRASIVEGELQNALSFLDVQASALRQIYAIFSRISDLRIQATDATMVPTSVDAGTSTDPSLLDVSKASKTTGDRVGYQAEYLELRKQLTFESLARSNGASVFNASGLGLTVQLTEDGSQTMTISRPTLFDGTDFLSVRLSGGTVSTSVGALGTVHDQPILLDLKISALDQAIQMLSAHLAINSGEQSRLKFSADRLGIAKVDFDASKSRFADTDISQEAVQLTRAKTVHEAAVHTLTQATKSTEFILKLIEARQGS